MTTIQNEKCKMKSLLRAAATAFAFSLFVFHFSFFIAPGRGQAPGAASVPVSDVKKLQNLGADTCRQCHRGPSPEDDKDKITEFIRKDEYALWQQQDLHAKAFEVLSGPLGKQMGEALGWGDVSKRVECLACHATNLAQELTPGIPQRATTADVFFTKDGVGCEACHGVADKWFRPHFDKSWRSVTPEEKLTKYGERDIRDPHVRADRCASCHVGTLAEGKFVTHAMFAAGHPPLPPLETLTYSHDQPMHYIPPQENKYINGLSDADAWRLFHVRKGESANARQMAVGAAVGFREAMKTLAAAADESKNGQVLDFALFDCAACHHDLTFPSPRQKGQGSTGRPMPRSGPTALLRTVAGGEGGDFDGKFAALEKACDAKPFGDPAAIGSAARELSSWADGVAKRLNDEHYDDARTAQVRRAIADTARNPGPRGRGPDYDDAQQLLWAFDALKPVSPNVTELLSKLAGPADSDAPMLGRLWEPGKWEPGKRPLIATLLPDRLRKASQYRPETFRDAFERIAGQLGPMGR
jgi:hypothetical protein